MKKKLLFASLMLVAGSVAFAQTATLPLLKGKLSSVAAKKALPSAAGERNMTCTNDTLYYPYLKEVLVSTAAPNFGGFGLMTGSTSFGSGYSQAYLGTGSTTISGVSFWGFVNDAVNPSQSLTVTVGVYNVNASNLPTTPVATTTVTLTGTVDDFYNANFTVPATVTGNYAVVVQNLSTTDTLGIVVNDAQTTTYGEGLAGLQYSGTWYGINTLLGGTAAYEAVISPIVSYPIATNFTTSANPVCLGTPITFTNTTTPSGLIGSRMYNYNKFANYWTLAGADSTYVYDMGDLSPLIWSSNTTYTYAASGTYSATLATLTGLWNSCVDTKTTSIVVNDYDDATITPVAGVCSNAAAFNLSAVTTGGTWSGTGITSASAGTFDPAVAGAGSHMITYTTAGPCPDTDNTTIVVTAVDDATITDPGMICDNDIAFNLTAATAGGTWSGTGITNASMGTFDPAVAGSGTHTITYTTAGTCSGTDNISIVVSVCSGIQGHDASAAVTVYPNPSNGLVTVNVGRIVKSTVNVYNVVGAEVLVREFNSQSSTLDLSGLDAGVYFIKVTTDNGQVTKQITLTK
jgi:hypothetical protein